VRLVMSKLMPMADASPLPLIGYALRAPPNKGNGADCGVSRHEQAHADPHPRGLSAANRHEGLYQMVEKLRIHISQIFAVLLVVLICVSRSLWEDKAPLVIKSEEAELARLHKDEFEMYFKKVPRFSALGSYLSLA